MYRRKFVKMCALGVASAGLGPAAIATAGAGGGTQPRGAEPLGSLDSFQRQLNHWFWVDDGQWIALQLTSVVSEPETPEVEQFSLYLRGSSKVDIAEGLYGIESDQGESLEMYLQVAGDEAGQSDADRYYRASFALLQ